MLTIESPGTSWSSLFLQGSLFIAVILSTLVTIIIFTLPSAFNPNKERRILEDDFIEDDNVSGDDFTPIPSIVNKTNGSTTSVVVLVLGDIGRSPRMQYHATSIAAHGGQVDLVGYVESDILPEIQASRLIRIVPLSPIPARLRTTSRAMFPIIAPLKVLYQVWNLYSTLGYKVEASKFVLVQNPPSVPTLLIAQIICYLRHSKLIIDWHNLGHTILALKLGKTHPLVRISEAYEKIVARFANGHFAVSRAMVKLLKQRYGIEAQPLYDRPAKLFQPLTTKQRSAFLARLPATSKHAKQIEHGSWRLLVSSTSWTPDEDFSILLDALVAYSATVEMNKNLPKILAIITGKGPLKEYYLKQIDALTKDKKLKNTHIHTAWLTIEDYASLLGSADLGVSLHMSSSGVDLPMKVVDMFGAGLPVVGWDEFEAWPELVQEGVNGRGFNNAEGLEVLLETLFGQAGTKLDQLRVGAQEESTRRWEDEWPTAAKTFGVSDQVLATS